MLIKAVFRKFIEVLKKINTITINITNFFFCLIIYFFGAGLSSITWRLFSKKGTLKKKNSYWIKSKKLDEKYEDYLKQFQVDQ